MKTPGGRTSHWSGRLDSISENLLVTTDYVASIPIKVSGVLTYNFASEQAVGRRRSFLQEQYRQAKNLLIHEWQPMEGAEAVF